MKQVRRSSSFPVLMAILAGALGPWLDAAENPAAPLLPPRQAPTPEVAATIARGRSLRNGGDDLGAEAAFQDALAQARASKDQCGAALALNNIASLYRYRAGLGTIAPNQQPPADLVEKAGDFYQQAIRAAQAGHDPASEAYAKLYLGVLAAGRSSPDEAFRYFQDALTSYRALNDSYYTARTLAFMGATELHRREHPLSALKWYEQALPLFRDAQYWHEAQAVLRDMDVAYQQLRAKDAPRQPGGRG